MVFKVVFGVVVVVGGCEECFGGNAADVEACSTECSSHFDAVFFGMSWYIIMYVVLFCSDSMLFHVVIMNWLVRCLFVSWFVWIRI